MENGESECLINLISHFAILISAVSGHSKWSTIKRQKGANDAKRGVAFTKLGNAITIAVREGGGGDPDSNFKLRLAMDKAREANMPKENISRAIDRGLGKGGEVALENVLYEGFAPHGVAVLIESVTDNKNRTNGEVKNILSKGGGALGSSGSVGYLFKKQGEIVISKSSNSNKASNPNEILEIMLNSGAEDMTEDEEAFIVYTRIDNLHQVKTKLEEQGLKVDAAELVYTPNKETMIALSDEEGKSVINLLSELEDLDDVQNVYSNLA